MSAMLFRNSSAQNPFGSSGLTPGSRPEDSAGLDDGKLLWDVSRTLNDHFAGHQKSLPRMMQMIKDLQATLEETRVAYNQVLQDRDLKRQQLAAAEGRLGDVQRVVQRYTVVQEPVVASDGYTYERSTIKQYLDECEQTETHAYSQQTKEVLTDTLIPNQSLKKLVELLKTVKPNEVPAATPRNPIPPIRGGSSGGAGNNSNSVNFLEDEDYADAPTGGSSNKDNNKVFHASDLEAALSTPANNGGKGRDRNNANSANAGNNNTGDSEFHSRGGKRGGNDGEGEGRKEARERRSGGDNEPPARQQKEKGGRGGERDAPRLHPCLRVYGFCNFKDDCTFAKYPYDACLNNIKGKCRFGPGCKELHVNPSDSKYQNSRAQQAQGNSAAAPPAPRSQRDKRDE